MGLRAWWARLFGRDDETRAVRADFLAATATAGAPPVVQAVDDVLAATERACLEARLRARRTPPPMPRRQPIPSIPEDL
jgi:hypothetical protein